jgi:glutamine amidotransferase
MITVIDIKMGNISSVVKALSYLNCESLVTDNPKEILKADKIIFPGVGSFLAASRAIDRLQLKGAIHEAVLHQKKPFLGICLGMQLIGDTGTEGGESSKGLELVRAETLHLKRHPVEMIVPHVGWNDVQFNPSDPTQMYAKISNNSCFYFVHSYEVVPQEQMSLSYANYDVQILASLVKDNIWGTQFHPEKSQKVGLQLLKNFVAL